jgi:hypothetical protein
MSNTGIPLDGTIVITSTRCGGDPVTLLTVTPGIAPPRMTLAEWRVWVAADHARMVAELECWIGRGVLALYERERLGRHRAPKTGEDSMRKLDKEVIAYNEAGHAVVGLYFGHDIEVVTIARKGDAAGSVAHNRADHDALRYEDELQNQVIFERAIMAAMAGEVAQRKFAPDSIEDVHAATDRRLMNEYLEELDAATDEIREAWARLLNLRTIALIDRLWPHVERLATALLKRKTLTRDEAKKAMHG